MPPSTPATRARRLVLCREVRPPVHSRPASCHRQAHPSPSQRPTAATPTMRRPPRPLRSRSPRPSVRASPMSGGSRSSTNHGRRRRLADVLFRWRRGSPRSESGDTLIELLMALVIISLAVSGLIAALIPSITTSGEHRTLSIEDTLLRSYAETDEYQLQSQPSPLFQPCATL